MKDSKDCLLSREFLTVVLDKLFTNIFLTDIETDEIVYMNAKMKKLYNLEEAEGKICWQVLQKGMQKRCSFCKKPRLLEGDCEWNEVNTINGRIYKNHDSLIQWEGKTYHIQKSSDVTEYIELSESARMDELTKMLNRRAGKAKLAELMEKAKEEHKILAVALYDINELKKVNDKFGHGEGDRLLRYVADVTKNSLRSEDIIFRLSGDEFILVFYDETIQGAENRIRAVLKQLSEERIKCDIFYEVSFSFGVAEVHPEDSYLANDIIAQADEKMYIQKRDYHILSAKGELLLSQNKNEKIPDFSYNRKHLFEALAASTEDYIFIGNMKTGVFQYSPAMLEEFAFPDPVVKNAAAFWGSLVHPQDENLFLESNQEIMDGRVDYHCIEYRAKNARGEWVWMRCKGKLIKNGKGEPELFAGFISKLDGKGDKSH